MDAVKDSVFFLIKCKGKKLAGMHLTLYDNAMNKVRDFEFNYERLVKKRFSLYSIKSLSVKKRLFGMTEISEIVIWAGDNEENRILRDGKSIQKKQALLKMVQPWLI